MSGPHPGTAAPPDWYPDPAGIGQYRYWDGTAWTPGVVIQGRVTERPMPPFTGHVAAAPGGPAVTVALPPRALWIALAGFVGGVVGGIALVLAGEAGDLSGVVLLVLAMAALWTGLIGACVVASRRFGTGSLRQDFGLRFRPSDLGWGLLTSIAARVLGAVLAVPIILRDEDGVGPQSGLLEDLERNAVTIIVVSLVAVIGAPIVEELFFRGLLQQALIPKLGVPVAIGVQAVLFSVVHLSPTLGADNLIVLAIIVPAGVVLGIAARARGLGTSIVGHSLFNVVAVIASIAQAS